MVLLLNVQCILRNGFRLIVAAAGEHPGGCVLRTKQMQAKRAGPTVLFMSFTRGFTAVVVLCLGGLIGATACTPPSGSGPAPTRLQISTLQTICGGRVVPGVPFCRPPTFVSRSVEVSRRGQVIATGTTDSTGKLLVEVPAGTWVVTVPGAMVYEDCDQPVVTAAPGATTRVTQTCVLNVP